MTINEKNKYIEDYVKKTAANVNYKYSIELVNDEKTNHIIAMFYNSQDDLETYIIPQINDYIQHIIDNFLEQLKKLDEVDKNNSTKSASSNSVDDKTANNEKDTQLSPLMISVLSLINCSSIDEINKYIDSVPNLYTVYPIPKANYNPELIEAIKKNIFKIFQSSVLSLSAFKIINGNNKDDAMRYVLHKQLSGLNLSIEEELKLSDIGLKHGLSTLYRKIEEICIVKYGKEEGRKISNKIVNYYTTDFDDFKTMTYEQMQTLNESLKAKIQKSNENNEDFQLVINSLKHTNTLNNLENTTISTSKKDDVTLSKQFINNSNEIVKLKCIKSDLEDYNNWNQAKKQVEQKAKEKKSDINQLFQQDNQISRKVEKQNTQQISKPKAKVLAPKSTNNSTTNKGFSNTLVILLSFIVCFIGGVLLIFICSFYK